MNAPRRVVGFVAWSTALLLGFSIAAYAWNVSWTPFDRINLISDVVRSDSAQTNVVGTTLLPDSIAQAANPPARRFERYTTAARIINFQTDSARYALPHFLERLHTLRQTKKGKIRIAYFGDSMIEGDLMTQTLRELLQKNFGGTGVGYVPITSIVAGFRQTVRSEYSRGWSDRSFKQNPGNAPLYLSGHAFSSQSDWARYTDRTRGDSSMLIQKYLLCGPDSNASIQYQQQERTIAASGSFNRILLSTDAGRTLSLSATSNTPTLYGVSFESPDGIILDNFSFRGITGIELAKLSANWLQAIQQQQPYDLIVFQYGVNLLFRPMDKDFRWYGKAMQPVIERFKQTFPEADILVVSTADRAFRYSGGWASAVGIDSLVAVQAKAAFQSDVAFYNQFATMGGTNSIVDWANRNPSWAGKDYVHPNARGAAWLGESLYKAILREYRLYTASINRAKPKPANTP
jgi:lysophospholipase L1-like esterase